MKSEVYISKLFVNSLRDRLVFSDSMLLGIQSFDYLSLTSLVALFTADFES